MTWIGPRTMFVDVSSGSLNSEHQPTSAESARLSSWLLAVRTCIMYDSWPLRVSAP